MNAYWCTYLSKEMPFQKILRLSFEYICLQDHMYRLEYMQIIMKTDQIMSQHTKSKSHITWTEKEESNFKNQNPESGYTITLKKLCTGHRVLELKFQVICSDEMLKYLGIIRYWSWNTRITFLATLRRFLPIKMQIKYKNTITFFHRCL